MILMRFSIDDDGAADDRGVGAEFAARVGPGFSRSAVGGAAAESSWRLKVRPSAGMTPRRGRVPSVMRSAGACWGSATPVILTESY